MKQNRLAYYLSKHYIHRSAWIRASVLGANDGIISTASLAIGVASAGVSRETLLLTTVAGVVSGALSMAAGEYVSVSSQTDIEKADIARERQELQDSPKEEEQMLALIYEIRGLRKETAEQVARELTEKNALEAHLRDELGITQNSQAQPIRASLASGSCFLAGGIMPLMVCFFAPMAHMQYYIYGITIFSLFLLGGISAKTGGATLQKSIFRILILGTFAMFISAIVGYFLGVNV